MKQSDADITLKPYRDRLDQCDAQLLECLRTRTEVIRQIAIVKRDQNIPVMQNHRVQSIYAKVSLFSRTSNLSERMLKKVFEAIIEESCRIEEEYKQRGA